MTVTKYTSAASFLILFAISFGWQSGYISKLWANCDASPDADCLLGEAEKTLAAVKDPATRATILVTVASAWNQRGDKKRAFALYEAAEKSVQAIANTDIQPRIRENMAVTAAMKGDKDHARDYFQQIIDAALAEDILSDFQRNMLYNTLSMQAVAGDLEGALENVARLRTRLWRAEALLMMADMMVGNNKREHLATIMPQALKAVDAIAGADVRLKMMSQMVRLLAASGDIETAQVMAAGIENAREYSASWGWIAREQALAGDIAGALESFAKIEYESARDNALWRIAVAMAAAGDFEGAGELLAEISDPLPRDQARGDVAALHAAAGNLETALRIADSLDAGFVRYRAWRQIADALVEANDPAGAIEAANRIEKDGQRKSVLASIASKLAHNGQIDESVKMLGLIEDAATRAHILSAIAAAQARAGEIDRAIATARAIETPAARANALVAVSLAMDGD